MGRFFFFLSVFIILLSLFNAPVTAFVISPPQYEVTFAPNSQKALTLIIRNNAQVDTALTVTVLDHLLPTAKFKQEIQSALSIDQSTVAFRADENSKTVTLSFNFPTTLSCSGTHRLWIEVAEAVPAGGMVGSRAASVLTVLLNVPQEYAQVCQPETPAAQPEPAVKPAPPIAPIVQYTTPQTPTQVQASAPQPLPQPSQVVVVPSPSPLGPLLFALLLTLALVVYLAPQISAELWHRVQLVSLSADPVERGQRAIIRAAVANLSHVLPAAVTASVLIKNAQNQVVRTLQAEPFMAPVQSRRKFEIPWDTRPHPSGYYLIGLTVHSGRQTMHVSTYAQIR